MVGRQTRHSYNLCVPVGLRKSGARRIGTEIDTTEISVIGLRDRALIALMVFSLARVGAALSMKVEDVYTQNRRLWVRLREKGGKAYAMPCHHSLEECLHAYIDGTGLLSDPKGPLFRTIGRGTGRLSTAAMTQADAHAMIRRRAAAGIKTLLGNHSFRATGITDYPKNGGTLERPPRWRPRQHPHHPALRSQARGDDPR